ncbi:hypothetical protein ALMP_11860 [Streptomyces sp. A012304]|nr:hypothetical protein ALMP_11860 [Streptomyces sp. A012304]
MRAEATRVSSSSARGPERAGPVKGAAAMEYSREIGGQSGEEGRTRITRRGVVSARRVTEEGGKLQAADRRV